MAQYVEWNWQKLKKYTGTYRCSGDVNNLTIRVQLKEIEEDSLRGEAKTTETETKTFRWQEKAHGKYEREFYRDERNCVTDLEKKYHDDVVRLAESDDVLYTYVDEDEFCGEEDFCKSTGPSKLMRNEGHETSAGYDFEEHFYGALENPCYDDEDFQRMFIMADFGESVEDTWVKSECVICTLKYCRRRNLLLVHPDFTVHEPYHLKTNSDLTRRYVCAIENLSGCANPETETLNKIASHEAKRRARAVGVDFDRPPKGKLVVYLFCEILTGKNFDHDDVYVQYSIELPSDHWGCADPDRLKGVTYSSRTKDTAHFGFPFEVALECDLRRLETTGDEVPGLPYIYFEVVSKDTWGRYRSEGFAYRVLPVSRPGIHLYQLQCFRVLHTGNLRRFFIGDCSSYDDLTWLAVPKDHEGPVISKLGVDTIGTGQIDVRMNVVHHSQTFAADGQRTSTCSSRGNRIMERMSSSALVKSVEEVLAAFKRARKNMMEAKKKV